MAALCDLDETKLHATAEKFGIERTYTDYRKMLAEVFQRSSSCPRITFSTSRSTS